MEVNIDIADTVLPCLSCLKQLEQLGCLHSEDNPPPPTPRLMITHTIESY